MYDGLSHSIAYSRYVFMFVPEAMQISYSHSYSLFKSVIEQQDKSEGFESCDRPIVRKRPIWVKFDDY